MAHQKWRHITSGLPLGLILELALFNNFISDLDGWAEHTFSRFADKIKLGEVADTRWLCHHSEGSGPAEQLLPTGTS